MTTDAGAAVAVVLASPAAGAAVVVRGCQTSPPSSGPAPSRRTSGTSCGGLAKVVPSRFLESLGVGEEHRVIILRSEATIRSLNQWTDLFAPLSVLHAGSRAPVLDASRSP